MKHAVLRSAALTAALLLAACGEHGKPAATPAAGAARAAILAFETGAPAIDAGQAAVLRWEAQGAVRVSIAPGVGMVAPQGSVAVRPGVTTAYTLTAVDAAGHVERASVTVNVHRARQQAGSYPILFVTQVPLALDNAARLSAFANHMTGIEQVPRGGDLMLRYPDGLLRNLTREAGYGNDGGPGASMIAVREPSVHWDGRRALFSMLVGEGPRAFWQLYEVRGLDRRERAAIVRVAGQPRGANNLSPFYGLDDSILFTSDRPRVDGAHLYPQLDEYEATPTTTGIWRLDRKTGALRILNHMPSGAFSPFVDSYGRIIFTRWDHLQQDQLAQRDRDAKGNGVAQPFGSFNYAGEAPGAVPLPTRLETFPESRSGSRGPYGEVSAFTNNFFTPWQMNADGSGEETLNHVGQHELSFGHLLPSFLDDPALSSRTNDRFHANRLPVRRESGLFHLSEDPRRPGEYLATAARETGDFGTGQLVRLSGSPALNGEQMTLTALTRGDPGDALADGRFRNPLALADGTIIASHAPERTAPQPGRPLAALRLVSLAFDPASGLYRAGAPLTAGIRKSLWWRSPAGRTTWSGELWEIEPAEVRPRVRPSRAQAGLEAPERAVLREEQVSEAELRAWLTSRDLALIVTRDQTSRDRADLQQPFNLRVPGGASTVSAQNPRAKVYDIAHFQLFEGEQVRAYRDRPGRRVIAQPLAGGANPANPGGPPGSARIAADGSTAAFVPARRALTWQVTDPQGTAVVRERNWITFQAGEMRVCASCHGVNTRDQAGRLPPQNKPQALRDLLRWWKTLPR